MHCIAAMKGGVMKRQALILTCEDVGVYPLTLLVRVHMSWVVEGGRLLAAVSVEKRDTPALVGDNPHVQCY
jgi:hypothetical protein